MRDLVRQHGDENTLVVQPGQRGFEISFRRVLHFPNRRTARSNRKVHSLRPWASMRVRASFPAMRRFMCFTVIFRRFHFLPFFGFRPFPSCRCFCFQRMILSTSAAFQTQVMLPSFLRIVLGLEWPFLIYRSRVIRPIPALFAACIVENVFVDSMFPPGRGELSPQFFYPKLFDCQPTRREFAGVDLRFLVIVELAGCQQT